MGQGQGSLTFNRKQDPAGSPAPPFALNSAYNGLSVDTVTGQIVFGQDVGAPGNPAQFVSNRVVPMFGFDLQLFGNDETDALAWLQWQTLFGTVNGRIGASDANGDRETALIWQLPASPLSSNILDLQTFTVNEVLSLRLRLTDAVSSSASLGWDNGAGYGNGMFIDFSNQLYQFGDVDDSFNGNQLSINDATQRWEIGQRTAIANLLLNFPAAGIGLSFFDSAGNNPFLLPDPGTGGIAFMSAPDFSTQIALSDSGSGSVADLGDVGAATTGMTLRVDVPNSEVVINDGANNAAVRINTVLGFTGVVAPVNTITVDGGIVTNVA